MSWQSTNLVTVSHKKDDYLGMFYAYYGLIVYCLPFVYLTLMFRDRHLHTWICCGSHFVHELLTKYLKKLIGEQRPQDGPPSTGLFDGPYGMPSQHVSCCSYVAVMVTMIIFYHYKGHGNFKLKILISSLLIIGVWIQCLARLHLKYHDLRQVLGGLAHGCTFALINFMIIEKNMPFASRICNWPIFSHMGFKADGLTKKSRDKIR